MNRYLLPLLLLPSIVWAELQISEAWIKNLPPPVPVRAGYMTIHNPQTAALTIESLHSDAFASIEIHQTIEQDGMMHMEQIPMLTIEPGSIVQLSPGGLHLMMMQPVEPTKPGDRVEIIIRLDDGSEQTLTMTVKP